MATGDFAVRWPAAMDHGLSRLAQGVPSRELVAGRTIAWNEDKVTLTLDAEGVAVIDGSQGARCTPILAEPTNSAE